MLRFVFVVLCSLFTLSATALAVDRPDLRKLGPIVRASLVDLARGVDPGDLVASNRCVTPDGQLSVFVLGDADPRLLEEQGVAVHTRLGSIRTASIPADRILSVASLPGVDRIVGARPGVLATDVAVPAVGAALERGGAPDFAPGANGAGVLIGAVDSGVDLSHGDFRDELGLTRLVSVWDQTDGTGPAPAGFSYGTEWTAAEINGGTALQTDTDGHGTAVLGTAAGDGSATGNGEPAFVYVGMAPRADLAMVKSQNYLTTDVVDGVAHIFNVASARAQDAVANLSLSYRWGPHDGTSAFEAALDALTGPGRIVVSSAGNWRGLPVHAEAFAGTPANSTTLSVSASDPGDLFWIDAYYDVGDTLEVTIMTPSGGKIGPVALGSENAPYPGQATAEGTIWVYHDLGYSTVHPEIYVEVTAQSGQNMDGVWTMVVDPVSALLDGEVDCWQASSGLNVAFVQGLDSSTEMVSEPSTAFNVLSAGAWSTKESYVDCNDSTITIPGFNTPPGTLASFSCPGPTRDGRVKPDIAAPGVWVGSAVSHSSSSAACPSPGTPAGVLPDGEHRASAGTSFSSPMVAGATALLLQTSGSLDANSVRALLAGTAVVDSFTGPVPNNDWGCGKLWIGGLVTGVPVTGGATSALVCRPNPSAMGFEILFNSPDHRQIGSLQVFDVAGREVADLTVAARSARGAIPWDGTSAAGKPVPAGIYFLRATVAHEVIATGKVTVLR